uniref:Uncharacterized protein n=1 Tax=Anguilla anguilla TaxID=7936 RepID=A0A0E9W6U1_ANGAN
MRRAAGFCGFFPPISPWTLLIPVSIKVRSCRFLPQQSLICVFLCCQLA